MQSIVSKSEIDDLPQEVNNEHQHGFLIESDQVDDTNDTNTYSVDDIKNTNAIREIAEQANMLRGMKKDKQRENMLNELERTLLAISDSKRTRPFKDTVYNLIIKLKKE
mmetsp:Transcript_3629/g.5362  ORF Transcript_3629/g.5362 Transcript_3629/m.5362 type:complete len:109 (+) Transcript_3629:71-397(+)